jgi:hypothetical protein
MDISGHIVAKHKIPRNITYVDFTTVVRTLGERLVMLRRNNIASVDHTQRF